MDAAAGAASMEEGSEATFFAEREEVLGLVLGVCASEDWARVWAEGRQRIDAVLNRYQEQPLLLAPHMSELVGPCTDSILACLGALSLEDRSSRTAGFQRVATPQIHAVCKILRQLCKVRGAKHVMKLLPHEVHHFEMCLFLLRAQDVNDYENWETRYVLFLWLSMLSLIPFDICSMDSTLHLVRSDAKSTLVSDIIFICKDSLVDSGPTREAAASCLATLLTRPDMDTQVLDEALEGFCAYLTSFDATSDGGLSFRVVGILQCLAQVFKRGHRNNLLTHCAVVLGPCLKISLLETNQTMTRKLVTKLVQWLGMTTLPPRIASWRYMRGQRSLLSNLAGSGVNEGVEGEAEETEESTDTPAELEDVIEHLLVSLRDKDTIVRWSAAKGIGRITMRLHKQMADDVVGAVLEQFADADNDLAWHGCCLALAELSRRGLLLPARLGDVVPLVQRAIHFDVLRGQHSVGLHVRDAACYVCWAFARAYSPAVMKPYIAELSSAMLLTALFDREINCRRAASAAFQENVGRQGNANFPLGIDIISIADYFSLGNRILAYSSIAPRVSAMDLDIHASFLSHLHTTKLVHWDSDIRELAAKSLAQMVAVNPSAYIPIMQALVVDGTSNNLYKRHGSVLGLSHMLLAFRTCHYSLPSDLLESMVQLVPQIDKARLYRGKGGELLRQASCHLIENLAACAVQIPLKTQVSLVECLNENLKQPHEYIRVSACSALRQFLFSYFPVSESPSENLQKLTTLRYVAGLDSEENVAVTRGYSLAIGALPPKLLVLPVGRLDLVYDCLFNATKPDKKIGGEVDAETRKNCIESLVEVAEKVCCEEQFTSAHLLRTFDMLFRACGDYNIDKRGDTGSWSRVVAMRGLERMCHVYFSFFAAYPQDPTKCAFSTYTTLVESRVDPQAGALVSTSFGYGVLESVDAALKVGMVRYPKSSLGWNMAVNGCTEVCLSNLAVVSLSNASTLDSSLLPLITYRCVLNSPFEVRTKALRADLLSFEVVQELICETVRIVFKQLAEKMDAVRDVAGNVLERLVYGSDPVIGYIIDRKGIIRALDANIEAIQTIEARKTSRSWASPSVAFTFLPLAMEMDCYFDAIVSGFIIAVGGISEAVVKESAAAFLRWCRTKKSTSNFRQLERLASTLLALFEAHRFDDRVIVPLMKTMDMLLKNDIFYFLSTGKHSFSARLLQLVKAEVNKSSDVGKLKLGIELLILLLGFDDPVRPLALRSIVMLLGHKYPKVRKHASELLYLQLLSDSVAVGPSPADIALLAQSGDETVHLRCGLSTSNELLDSANELLVTTAWDCADLTSVRAVREAIGTALGMSIAASVSAVDRSKNSEPSDELNSYSALVRDAGY